MKYIVYIEKRPRGIYKFTEEIYTYDICENAHGDFEHYIDRLVNEIPHWRIVLISDNRHGLFINPNRKTTVMRHRSSIHAGDMPNTHSQMLDAVVWRAMKKLEGRLY